MKTALESIMQALITAGWNNKSNGDVESPTGHYAVVEIPKDDNELADMVDAILDMATGAEIVALCTSGRGFYTVTENSYGHVFINGPYTEKQTTEWFESKDDAYGEWVGDDND